MIIYITGIIGAGKTTICNYIREKYNIEYISLDVIAKNVLKKPKIKNKMLSVFPTVFDTRNNTIIDSKLREIIFSNSFMNKKINSIVVPELEKYVNNEILKNPKKDYIIEGIGLEININKLDKVIKLKNYKKRKLIQRVKRRNGFARNTIKKIIKIQNKRNNYNNIKYTNIPRYIIKNDSSLRILYRKIDKLFSKFMIKKI